MSDTGETNNKGGGILNQMYKNKVQKGGRMVKKTITIALLSKSAGNGSNSYTNT